MYKMLLKLFLSCQLLFLKSKDLNYLSSITCIFCYDFCYIKQWRFNFTCKVLKKPLNIYILKYNLAFLKKYINFNFFQEEKATHLRNSVLLFNLNKYIQWVQCKFPISSIIFQFKNTPLIFFIYITESVTLKRPEISNYEVCAVQGNSLSLFEMPLQSESPYCIKGVPWPAVVPRHTGTVSGIPKSLIGCLDQTAFVQKGHHWTLFTESINYYFFF